MSSSPRVLRAAESDEIRVTNMELFFDLVYVFAITQLSEFLYGRAGEPTARVALEALVLFVAVWMAWNYTAWATNWIDPDRPRTALTMMLLMALGLFMAAALPRAFDLRGAPFAITYVALGLVRTGFVAGSFPAGDPMRSNNLQLLAWLAIGGVPWILGAYLAPDARLVAWLIAIVLELTAPMHGFRLPGRDAIPVQRWRLTGSHLAERYQLILMVALGESVLRVGLTASEGRGSVARDAAWLFGFLACVALWGLYFLRLADRGAERVAGADEEAARVGRGYMYAHAAMVAGVIVVAVAIHTTIHGPDDPTSIASTFTILGGPALFLLGLGAFERFAGTGPSWRTLAAIGVLGLLVVAALLGADQLALSVCSTAVLIALAVAPGPRPTPRPSRRARPAADATPATRSYVGLTEVL